MASFPSNGKYASIATNPTTSADTDVPLEFESVEMTTLGDVHTSGTRALLRRDSTASIESTTSSEAPPQRYRTMKRMVDAVSNSLGKFDSTIQGRMRRSRFYGWRMGVFLGSCMSAFVLCCNIIAVVVANSTGTMKQGNILDIMSGSVTAVSRWSTIFHLIMNLFSTMLLAASNYTMQVLCSPTRADIDNVHAKGLWLDVGLLSLRNLRYLPRGRVALGLVLGFSSIPLHLL
jgi:hypothetical protein